jgi:hypothetical protein
MSIAVQCGCGKTYRADDSLAGRRVKCQACGSSLVVPDKQPVAAGALDDPLQDPLSGPLAAADPLMAARSVADPLLPAPGELAAPAATPSTTASALPFFLAVSHGLMKSLVYRVYVDRDALLLLDVCPYNVMIDVELARHADGSHWAVKTVQSLRSWVLASAGTFGVALGVLGLAIARNAFRQPNEALQLTSFLVTIAAIAIPVLILFATWTMRVLVRRSRQLDSLRPDELRLECANGGDKHRLMAGELSEVKIAPPKNSSPAIRHQAEVTFKHPSGQWRWLLLARQDVQLAIAAFRRLLNDRVEIDAALEKV